MQTESPFSGDTWATPVGVPDYLAHGEPYGVLAFNGHTEMAGRISKSTWRAVLHQPTKPLRAAGEPPSPGLGKGKSDNHSAYHAGMPLRPGAIQRDRDYGPLSADGASIFVEIIRLAVGVKTRTHRATSQS